MWLFYWRLHQVLYTGNVSHHLTCVHLRDQCMRQNWKLHRPPSSSSEEVLLWKFCRNIPLKGLEAHEANLWQGKEFPLILMMTPVCC